MVELDGGITRDQFVAQVGTASTLEVIIVSLLPVLVSWTRQNLVYQLDLKLSLYSELLLDFCLFFIPSICCLTYASNLIMQIFTSIFLANALWTCRIYYMRASSGHDRKPSPPPDLRKWYSTQTTTCVMILTCLMISAIDFPLCPRRFAKTHHTGFSLMDSGTGWAMIVSAMSGARVIVTPSESSGTSSKFKRLIYVGVLPLLSLGCLRSVLISILNYHQVSEEYGLHWNFFITIALARLVSIVLLKYPFFPVHQKNRFASIWPAVIYTTSIALMFLSGAALAKYWADSQMLLEPSWPTMEDRTQSLWIANAEGLLSLSGYLSLHFAAVAYFIIINSLVEQCSKRNLTRIFLYSLAVFSILMACLQVVGWTSISRRFISPGYVFLMLAITTLIISAIIAIGFVIHLCQEHPIPVSGQLEKSTLVSIISTKAASYFIIANVLTGLVNFLTDTLQFVPPGQSVDPVSGAYAIEFWPAFQQMAILFGYSFMCFVFTFSVSSSATGK